MLDLVAVISLLADQDDSLRIDATLLGSFLRCWQKRLCGGERFRTSVLELERKFIRGVSRVGWRYYASREEDTVDKRTNIDIIGRIQAENVALFPVPEIAKTFAESGRSVFDFFECVFPVALDCSVYHWC